MENRANYALVGVFTLAVIAAIFSFVWWFRASNEASDRIQYRIIFTGSVSGLSNGAIVRFNGIKVGEVKTIGLVPEDPSHVFAIIAISPTTPVRTDTRARLEYQGLTGVASVHLAGASNTAPLLTPTAEIPQPTINADRSDFQDLFETAQRLSAKIDTILDRANALVEQNQEPITQTIRNVQTFSKALADNADGIGNFLSSVGETAKDISALSIKLERLSDDIDGIVKTIEPGSVSRTVKNVEAVTATLAESKADITAVLSDTATLVRRLNDTSVKLDSAIASASQLIGAVDAQKINAAIDNVTKVTDALGRHGDDVDQTLKDAASIGAKLNNSADKVDRVLSAAESFFGVEDGANGVAKNMFSEITETAKSLRILSQNLDKRTADITAGINKFSGPGLRDFEALSSDARQAVNQVNRAVRSLDRNPSQLIFGAKPPVPEYNGSR